MHSSSEPSLVTSKDATAEEIFCLHFELQTLSQLVFRSEAERWLHGYMLAVTEDEHLSRYKHVAERVEGKHVLDVACGSGYGSYLLAEKGLAVHVDGLDINPDSIRYAAHRHGHPAVRRWVGDAEQYCNEEAYDVIVSFETVEHLPNYKRFLQNVSRSLAPGGVLYISTPIREKTITECANPYHVIEWSFNDFQNLISEYVDIREIYVQSIHLLTDAPKTSLFHRVVRKLRPAVPATKRSLFEPYTAQYDSDQIWHGYQMLVCHKR